MRTNVRETSIRAWDAIQADGRALTQAARVLAYITAYPGCSRSDIAEGMRLRLASVCGRVKAMLEEEHPPIVVRGEKVDPVTKMSVERLYPTPAQSALDLEDA